MAFPHPQSRKDHHRKEEIASWGSIVWKFFKRTINVTQYRNAEDEVNPAKNRTLGGSIHSRLRELGRCIVLQSSSIHDFSRWMAQLSAVVYPTTIESVPTLLLLAKGGKRETWHRHGIGIALFC